MTKQNETFSHEVVASLMTSHFVDVLATITVAEAMKQYRAQNAEIDKDVHNIYVVDETHKLVGMLSLSVMVGAEPEKKVGDLLSKEPPISAVIDESTHDVAGRMQQLNVAWALTDNVELVGGAHHSFVLTNLDDEDEGDVSWVHASLALAF